MLRIISFFFLILGSMSVFAVTPGFFLSASIGKTSLKNLPDAAKETHGSKLGGRIAMGYNLSSFFGIEMGYGLYGATKYTNRQNNQNFTYHLSALSFLSKAYVPLGGSNISVVGTVGFAEMFGSGQKNVQQTLVSASERGLVSAVGSGFNFDLVGCNISFEYLRTASKSSSSMAIPAANMWMMTLQYII